MAAHEINFDGLVGPTHNYAGLSAGNLHSMASARSVSAPRRAAHEGLAKMRRLHDMGLPQAVLPPHPRPDLHALRAVGFEGSDTQVLTAAAEHAPELLASVFSASGMWAANAATVSPSADSSDGRLHLTPANLTSFFHRSIEPAFVTRLFRRLFPMAAVHEPLPACDTFSDEGAANHTRFGPSDATPGVQFFVYGREANETESAARPARFRARHTLEASRAVARLHRLDPARVVYARQSPAAIDAGVFHNDVIAVGRLSTLLYHEDAFQNTAEVLAQLKAAMASLPEPAEFHAVRITRAELPLDEINASYLFNSQLVHVPSDPAGALTLIAPTDTESQPNARAAVDRVVAEDNPIVRAVYVDVRQSMRNGGGPACLRLRVAMNQAERAELHPGVLFTETLHAELDAWVDRHYRVELSPADLADPALGEESRRALTELESILGLEGLYE
ncbi:MAG: N-succinylarginine dihydrolase [Planctomycetota bacterium]